MSQNKVLYESPNLHMVERDGMVGVIPLFMNVVIMPFVSDEQGLPLAVGVLEENNPFREGGRCVTLITGTSDEEDPDLLSTAKRELFEESGFEASENERWYFLGSVTSSKFVDHEQPCFAVDVTGLDKMEAPTDGSEQEQSMEFKFIPANDVVKSKDIFIPGLFLKLFKYVLGIDIQGSNQDGSGGKKSKGFNFSI
jgi:8-oxo-dGTP pyrophosphatase MutT (NUDIX family)